MFDKRNNNFKKKKKVPVGGFLNFLGGRKVRILLPPIKTRSHFKNKIKSLAPNNYILKIE